MTQQAVQDRKQLCVPQRFAGVKHPLIEIGALWTNTLAGKIRNLGPAASHHLIQAVKENKTPLRMINEDGSVESPLRVFSHFAVQIPSIGAAPADRQLAEQNLETAFTRALIELAFHPHPRCRIYEVAGLPEDQVHVHFGMGVFMPGGTPEGRVQVGLSADGPWRDLTLPDGRSAGIYKGQRMLAVANDLATAPVTAGEIPPGQLLLIDFVAHSARRCLLFPANQPDGPVTEGELQPGSTPDGEIHRIPSTVRRHPTFFIRVLRDYNRDQGAGGSGLSLRLEALLLPRTQARATAGGRTEWALEFDADGRLATTRGAPQAILLHSGGGILKGLAPYAVKAQELGIPCPWEPEGGASFNLKRGFSNSLHLARLEREVGDFGTITLGEQPIRLCAVAGADIGDIQLDWLDAGATLFGSHRLNGFRDDTGCICVAPDKDAGVVRLTYSGGVRPLLMRGPSGPAVPAPPSDPALPDIILNRGDGFAIGVYFFRLHGEVA